VIKVKSSFIVYAVLLGGLCVVVSPIAFMFLIAFMPRNEIFAQLIPSRLTLENFVSVLLDSEMMSAYGNSWRVSSLTTLLTIPLASLGGYGLSRYQFKLKTGFIMMLLITQMLPTVLLAVGYFPIIKGLGLYNTRMALVILNTTLTLPFCTLLLKSIFDGVPVEIEGAAMIDGCSRVGSFLRIVLPLSWAGLCAAAIFSFIAAWQEYLYALTFTSDYNAITVTVEITKLLGHYVVSWNRMMSLAILTTMPILVMFTAFQKLFIKGLTGGGLKQ